jgi:hypothetical protein
MNQKKNLQNKLAPDLTDRKLKTILPNESKKIAKNWNLT